MLQDVNKIIKIINENNKKAYLVGGAVRDMVLNRPAHDFDITTNMSYEDLEKVFPKNYPSGKAFGIITIFFNNEEYEIAHFRTDGQYSDNRHCEVELVETIEEDLKRRDFTINAMAWNEDEGFIDPFNGKLDLENKLIRAVGNPDERFNEDGLRMLRAIRFSAQLGFDIENETYLAIKKNAHLIKNISAERIEAELTKILISDHPEKIIELYNTKISDYIFPEFNKMFECEQNNPNHIYNVGIHTLKSLQAIKNDKILRWTMLLHDIGKPDTKFTKEGVDHFYDHPVIGEKIASDILKRFKFSNAESYEILKLIKMHDIRIKKLNKLRFYAAQEGAEFFDKLKLVQLADVAAQSDYQKEEKLQNIAELNANIHKVIDDKSAIKLADLQINGNDLIDLGFSGLEIGAILKELYGCALNDPKFNDRKRLLDKARSYKTKNLDKIIEDYTKSRIKKSENIKVNEEISK